MVGIIIKFTKFYVIKFIFENIIENIEEKRCIHCLLIRQILVQRVRSSALGLEDMRLCFLEQIWAEFL